MTCCRKGSDTVYILTCFLANISSLHVQKHFAKSEATITFHVVLMDLFEPMVADIQKLISYTSQIVAAGPEHPSNLLIMEAAEGSGGSKGPVISQTGLFTSPPLG